MFLAPHDPAFDAAAGGDAVLSVDALCLNRDLPAALPFGGGHPGFTLVEASAAVHRVACLTAPTATLRMPVREKGFWRLVSHLSLGHLSVVGGAAGAEALREVLRLYDWARLGGDARGDRGPAGVSSAPGTARVRGRARPARSAAGWT